MGIAETKKREDIALKALSISNEMLTKVTGECTQASAKVDACFVKKIPELMEVKRQLHEQLMESITTISDAERLLNRMQFHAKHAAPDAKPDPKKEEAMKKADAMLAELKEHKSKLQADHQAKTTALQIEQTCKNLIARRVDPRTPE